MDDDVMAKINAEKEKIKQEETTLTNFERNEVAPIEQVQHEKLVSDVISEAVVFKVKNDNNTKAKFLEASDKVIDNEISKVKSKTETESKKANFLNNKDACDLYGIDESTVPNWVVKSCSRVQNFLYAIWIVIGFFTTAPIVFLSKKIKVVVKKMWFATLVAIMIYACVIGVPILLRYIK